MQFTLSDNTRGSNEWLQVEEDKDAQDRSYDLF